MSTLSDTHATKSPLKNSDDRKLKDAYNLAGEAASDYLDGAKGHAKVKIDEGKEKAQELTQKAEAYIKEKPLVSIGAAFVAGWAISKLLK